MVLVARRNKFEFFRRLVPELQRVLHEVRPDEVRRVGVWTERGQARLTAAMPNEARERTPQKVRRPQLGSVVALREAWRTLQGESPWYRFEISLVSGC